MSPRSAVRAPRDADHPRAALAQAVVYPAAKTLTIEIARGDADHRHVEPAADHQFLQRREYLLAGEVAGRPEQHQRIGV